MDANLEKFIQEVNNSGIIEQLISRLSGINNPETSAAFQRFQDIASKYNVPNSFRDIATFLRYNINSVWASGAAEAGASSAQINQALIEAAKNNIPVTATQTGQLITNNLPVTARSVLDPLTTSWVRSQGGATVQEVTRNLPALTQSTPEEAKRLLEQTAATGSAASSVASSFLRGRGREAAAVGVLAALGAAAAYLYQGGETSTGGGWNAAIGTTPDMGMTGGEGTPTPTGGQPATGWNAALAANQSPPGASLAPASAQAPSILEWAKSFLPGFGKQPVPAAELGGTRPVESLSPPASSGVPALDALAPRLVGASPKDALLAISNIISIDIDDINKKITELDARYNSNASADAAWRVQTYPQLRQALEATKSLRLRDAVGIQEGLLKVQAAEDAKNPEVIGATIAQARASAAASNAQAVASLANAEKIRADIARAAELDPINSAILKAQLTVVESQAEQASYNTSKLQNKSLIEDKYLKGEITREQFAEQSAILSDKFFEYEQSAVAKAQLDLARSRQAFEQANADRAFGVTQRQLALQEQTAALAQTQAVAQNAVEQARLDLQRTAEARAAAQARAQNMQALTAAQTQRQAAYNQAATEYERFGVATPARIQGLQDLKAPLPAAQAAGMLGLDVNSPEFKAVYDTYSMALAPGQGAQQPVPAAAPAPAPAPVPNPVTNSIPLISMPSMGNTPYLTQALGGLKTGYSPA